MPRPSLLAALRRVRPQTEAAPPSPAPDPPPSGPRRRTAPPVGELRRERRALLRAREQRIRDLGGLALEMFRRDSFREHLLHEHCAEVTAIEDRLQELEIMLDARRPPAARCACGAPLFWGASFCGVCGRPSGERAPAACGRCGHALAADAQYCPSCGTSIDSGSGG